MRLFFITKSTALSCIPVITSLIILGTAIPNLHTVSLYRNYMITFTCDAITKWATNTADELTIFLKLTILLSAPYSTARLHTHTRAHTHTHDQRYTQTNASKLKLMATQQQHQQQQQDHRWRDAVTSSARSNIIDHITKQLKSTCPSRFLLSPIFYSHYHRPLSDAASRCTSHQGNEMREQCV